MNSVKIFVVKHNFLGFLTETFDFYSLNGHCARKKSYVQGGDNVNNVFDYILENYGNETTTLINKL